MNARSTANNAQHIARLFLSLLGCSCRFYGVYACLRSGLSQIDMFMNYVLIPPGWGGGGGGATETQL